MEPLTHSLTPVGLFMQAGPVGKTVLLILVAASICVGGHDQGDGDRTAEPGHPHGAARRSGFLHCASRADHRGLALTAAALTIPGRAWAKPGRELPDLAGQRSRSSRGSKAACRISCGHLVGGALHRPVRNGLGHHGELLFHRRKPRTRALPWSRRALPRHLAATAIGLAAAIPATSATIGSVPRWPAPGRQLQHLIEEDAVKITSLAVRCSPDHRGRSR